MNVPPDSTPTQTPPKRVLLIEDENFISDLYVRALKAGGYDPDVIVDGQQALKAAQTNAYDIILLDIMLPNMTGTEILNILRDPAQTTPNIKAKIIVTTNLELGDEGRAAMENKADGYIVKADITPKELVAFLNQIDFSTHINNIVFASPLAKHERNVLKLTSVQYGVEKGTTSLRSQASAYSAYVWCFAWEHSSSPYVNFRLP